MITDNLKYILTGHGAGGTTYTSGYLTKLGWKCGHEVFGVKDGEIYVVNHKDDYTECLGDSNWIAMDSYAELVDTPIILIKRNPLNVLCSMIAISCCMKTMAEITTGNPQIPYDVNDEIIRLVARYRRIMNHPRKVFEFRVEDQMNKLCEFIGIEYRVLEQDPPRNKHNPSLIRLDWDSVLKYPNGNDLKELAKEMGYLV